PAVNFRYCTAIEAMQRWQGMADTTAPMLTLQEIPSGDDVYFRITTDEAIFQPLPFVAAKDVYENYFVIPCESVGVNDWSTTEPLSRDQLVRVGVTVCDTLGNQAMAFLDFLPEEEYVDNVDSGYVEVHKSWLTSSEHSWGLDSRVTTLTAGDTAIARWYPNLADSATFNIFVQIPEISNPAGQITYKIFDQGACVDTVQFSGAMETTEWIYLGTNYLIPDAGTYLQVEASGDDQEGQALCADVARFSAAVRERDLFVVDQVLDFGAVPQEDSISLDITLKNLGYGDLTISGISWSHPAISIPTIFPVVIPGMSSTVIPVIFQPTEVGPVIDEMIVHSDDLIEPIKPVLVIADVQPYFVVVDNEDLIGYSEEGTWHTSVAQAYGPSSRYAFLNQIPGAKARFQAILSHAGIYRVYEIVPSSVNAIDHALYVLSIEGMDVDSIFIDQRSESGSWIHLWTRTFASGQHVEVRVEDAGGVTAGDVLRADAVKIAITVPPEAVDDLQLMVVEGAKSSSGDLYLSWAAPDAYEGVDRYVVYRCVTSSDPGDSLATTTITSYTDSNVVGNESMQYYYAVKCIDVVGNKSGESNRVGEFDKGLVRAK
ncbi:hypothetical protein ACFL0G_05120, partial [Candidatus Zixiibacteriota bacterium]